MRKKKDNGWTKAHGRRVVPPAHLATVETVITAMYIQCCRSRDEFRSRAARDAEGVHLETYRYWRSLSDYLGGVLKTGLRSISERDYLLAVLASTEPALSGIQSLPTS